MMRRSRLIQITVAAGIMVDSYTIMDGWKSVTVNHSGGTAGANYLVSRRVTTSLDRRNQRTMVILVRKK